MAEFVAPERVKQRLFFALWPNSAVREQIAVAAVPVIAGLPLPAVPRDNYHLTLVFLGAVSPAGVRDAMTAARGVRFAEFAVDLQYSGYWPRSWVVWLAPDICPQRLATLVDDLQHRLSGLGFAVDTRQFRPHVTLARDVDAAVSAPLGTAVHWRVQSFGLLESVPGVAGPVYRLLEEFPAWH